MTQSGQGEEPSARPAREGIVLPSDGGEPLLPGTTGGPSGGPSAQSDGQVPAGGQAWGRPWGPGQEGPGQQGPDPSAGQGWQAAGQSWGSPEQYPRTPQAGWDEQGGAARAGAGPLPPEGAPAPSYGAQQSYGGHTPQTPPGGHAYGVQGGQPQPSPYGAPGHGGAPGAGHPAAGADEGATQFLPPVTGAAVDEGATQFLPPVTGSPVNEGATQYLPPVAPGALPAEGAGDPATHYLGRIPQGGPGPVPPAAAGGRPDAEPTQYIPPVDAGGGRQTPAEFDNLFRGGPGGQPAGATQQLPRFQQQPAARPAHDPAGAGFGDVDGDGGGRGGRGTRSRVPLIATAGVAIVVLGVGAGALLAGGEDDGSGGKGNTTVSATAPATEGSSPSASADPARQQAVALDKLLNDSGSSRAAVIKAVADVKNCDNLDQAASGLRDAAEQRKGLVTRLGQLSVDKLPRNAELTAALTSAWRASESADRHYAAWADQAHGKKVCKKGHARSTAETQAGNRQSGVASAQKVKAAQLWNAIAKTYGLTQRQPTQL
ncbi:hypothetical protein [Streptomyces sp. NPDC003374]